MLGEVAYSVEVLGLKELQLQYCTDINYRRIAKKFPNIQFIIYNYLPRKYQHLAEFQRSVFDRLQPLRNIDKRNAAVIAAQDYYQMDPNEIDLIINWLWTFATTEKLADYFTVVNVGKIKTIKGMIQKNADVFYSLEETKRKKIFC